MKKFLAMCLAAMMVLASAAVVGAANEAPVVADEVVIANVKAPATAPIFGMVTVPVNVGSGKATVDGTTNAPTTAPVTAPTSIFGLKTVKVEVEATEGGKVSVPAKFAAAMFSSRAFTVTPDAGYEVADIIVNGVSYGPAYKVVLKTICAQLDVQVVFEPKLVEVFTPVYTENFDNGEGGWAKGGHMDSAVAENGVLKATSTGGDPNINHSEVFGLSCDAIDAIRVKFTNNTADNRFQIFFTNEANPGYSEAGSFKATIEPNAENEVVIYTAGNDLWTGTLQNMRIDLANGAGDFVVESISFETVTMELAK